MAKKTIESMIRELVASEIDKRMAGILPPPTPSPSPAPPPTSPSSPSPCDGMGNIPIQMSLDGKGDGKPIPSPIPVVPELEGLALYEADENLRRQWKELWPAWVVAYPGVPLLAEIRLAHAWEVSHRRSRKTDRPKFIDNWLKKAYADAVALAKEKAERGDYSWMDKDKPEEEPETPF